ncbi:MAG: hypothetical protein WBD20_20835 [Pirellulaceae bacterium]
MSIDSNSHLPSNTGMSAEAGFDGTEIQAPIRVSGFISLLLGLISAMSFLAIGMLIVPMAAIGFGMFGLRKYSGPTPVGIRAASIGILLAVCFGAFGLGVPLFKKNTLGRQAEHFAKQYVKLVAMGEEYYTLELKKNQANRYLRTMPLREHYEANEELTNSVNENRDDSLISLIKSVGPDGEWELDRPVRIYHTYGEDSAEVVLANYDQEKPRVLRLILKNNISKDGNIEWYVEVCMSYRDRIVAESIL